MTILKVAKLRNCLKLIGPYGIMFGAKSVIEYKHGVEYERGHLFAEFKPIFSHTHGELVKSFAENGTCYWGNN